MTKTKNKMITTKGDEQDQEKGNRVQGVVSLKRKRTPPRRGLTTLGRALNIKSYFISLPKEDEWKGSRSSPMHNFFVQIIPTHKPQGE
jgi:hypothetical protein